MESAQQQVEQLLDHIREVARNPKVERLTDQITVLCRAYLTPPLNTQWEEVYGFTAQEARMMTLLATRVGSPVSKGAALDAITFDYADEPQMKILDVMVCRMRRKLKAKNSSWSIETIWGQGYRANNAAEAIAA